MNTKAERAIRQSQKIISKQKEAFFSATRLTYRYAAVSGFTPNGDLSTLTVRGGVGTVSVVGCTARFETVGGVFKKDSWQRFVFRCALVVFLPLLGILLAFGIPRRQVQLHKVIIEGTDPTSGERVRLEGPILDCDLSRTQNFVQSLNLAAMYLYQEQRGVGPIAQECELGVTCNPNQGRNTRALWILGGFVAGLFLLIALVGIFA